MVNAPDFLPGAGGVRTSGCSANLTWSWKAADPESVAPGTEVEIKVKGPRVAGTYERRVDDSGTVTLKLSTPPLDRSNAEFDATIVSVAGQPASLPGLPHSFLNTECGGGPPRPASSLPPGTPVPGAPCIPGRPPPPGFVCK